jgi:hypothetical protein
MPHLRLLLAVLLLCLLSMLPDVAAGGSPDPTPTPWPEQFHAKLMMEYKGNLSLADLWYD